MPDVGPIVVVRVWRFLGSDARSKLVFHRCGENMGTEILTCLNFVLPCHTCENLSDALENV